MSDFIGEARQWNGEDDRPMASANGMPEPWQCLGCPTSGVGVVKRSKHWYETGHHIVWAKDPRAKDAPRGDETGRR